MNKYLKQIINNFTMSINKPTTCGGISHYSDENKVICPEMCFYCFDHLVNILDKSSKNIVPRFPNDS